MNIPPLRDAFLCKPSRNVEPGPWSQRFALVIFLQPIIPLWVHAPGWTPSSPAIPPYGSLWTLLPRDSPMWFTTFHQSKKAYFYYHYYDNYETAQKRIELRQNFIVLMQILALRLLKYVFAVFAVNRLLYLSLIWLEAVGVTRSLTCSIISNSPSRCPAFWWDASRWWRTWLLLFRKQCYSWSQLGYHLYVASFLNSIFKQNTTAFLWYYDRVESLFWFCSLE